MDPRARDGVEGTNPLPSEGRLTNMAYNEYRKASQVNNVDSEINPGDESPINTEYKQDRRTSTDKQSAPLDSETADQKAEAGPASRQKKHDNMHTEEADQEDVPRSNKVADMNDKKSSQPKIKRNALATLPKGGK